jgi:hypothetical protein
LLLSAAVFCAAHLHAQERITNAKMQTTSGAQGVSRAIRDIASRPTPTWVGYQVPMVADDGRRLCDGRAPRVFLEPAATFTVLARLENGNPARLRTFTPECDIDAGGMPLVWLTDVKPDDSVAWLASLVTTQPDAPRRDSLSTRAIEAIALHATPAAVPQLISLARGTKNADVRKDTMAWLGRSRDPQALKFLADLLTSK